MSNRDIAEMFGQFFDSEENRIDGRAEKDIASLTYVLEELIGKNFALYDNVFRSGEEQLDNNWPKELYSRVLNTLRTVQQHYLKGPLRTFITFPDGDRIYHPAHDLGWITLVSAESEFIKPYDHIQLGFELLDYGREVIDGWRSANGYCTIERQIEFNTERSRKEE
tara:strand:+ start:730 stop:1227 length:498 start_codon:yes stop_codon:yes gene_type:complete